MRSVNTRVHLSLRTVIYAAIVAEAEQIGFSISDVVNKALYDAGYGKPRTKSAAKPEPAAFDNNLRWKGESEHDYNERLAVQRRRANVNERAIARVLARYNEQGRPEIIFDE
jgi:hypothetical protein